LNIGEIPNGYDFERKILGISSSEVDEEVNDCFKFNRKGHRRNEKKCNYSNFRKAVGVVKDIQNKIGNWNPKEPSTEIARVLFESVASHLENRRENLRFYSSVGTLLDYKYGTDCFFILKDREYEAIITIDLTINRRKRKSKADIVLTADDLRNDSRYQKIMEMVASRLLHKIIENHKKPDLYYRNTRRR
jgi:hypothetical protein